jgi:hypothetical protein
MVLDAQEVVPATDVSAEERSREIRSGPHDKVPAEVARRLTDDLQTNVVPRLARDPAAVVHVLLGSIEVVEVGDALVAVVWRIVRADRLFRPTSRTLSRPDLAVLVLDLHAFAVESLVDRLVVTLGLVNERVLWGVPRIPSSLFLAGTGAHTHHRPKQRSKPPMKAMVSSITHIFSCYEVRGSMFRWRSARFAHVRPEQSARLRVRRRPLHGDIRMQRKQTGLGVQRVDGADVPMSRSVGS